MVKRISLICWICLIIQVVSVSPSYCQDQKPVNFKSELEMSKGLSDMFVRPGMVVAEIGSGWGMMAVYLAKRTGDEGHVYANEITEENIKDIKENLGKYKVNNATVILGKLDDPLLPKGVIDLAIMVHVWCHIELQEEMLESIFNEIKPGAILVIVDPDINQPGGKPGGCYSDPDEAIRMVKAAGFELVRRDSCTLVGTVKHYIIILQKPVRQ